MRRDLWAGLGVGLILLVVGGLASPAGAQDDLAVTVTPGFGLEDGDTVDVAGSGFVPGSVVFLTVCDDDPARGDDPVDRCSLVGAGSAGYRVAADGTLGVDDLTINTGQVGGSPNARCDATSNACSLNVTLEDLTVLVSVELGFGAPSALAVTGLDSAYGAAAAMALLGLGGLLIMTGGRIERRHLARLVWRRPSTIRDLPL